MKILRAISFALLLATPCLSAQKSFESLFPTEPFMELRVTNTKTSLADFKTSKIGKVVTDGAFAEIGEILSKNREWGNVLEAYQEADKKSGGILEKLKDLVLVSDANIMFAAGLRSVDEDDPQGWIILRLDGDKETLVDIAKIFEEEALKDEPTEVGDIDILGEARTFYTVKDEGLPFSLCFPFVHENSMYLIGSTDYEKDFGEKAARSHESLLSNKQAPLSVGLNLAAIMPMLREQMEAEMPEEAKEIVEQLGLYGFGRIELAWEVKRGRFVQEISLDIPEEGWIADLMKAFVPSAGKGLDLLRYVPDDIQAASFGMADLSEAYRLIKTLIDDIAEAQGMEDLDFEAMFQNKFGFDLVQGLIDPLDGRVSHFESLNSDGLTNEDASELEASTQCISLGVKAPAAFAKSVDTIIRKMGMHVSRKKESYRGFDLFHFKAMGMFEIHYGITDEFFLVALGAKPADMIRKVVDREKAIASGEKGFVADEGLTDQLALLPQNASALSVTDLVSMLTTISEMLGQNLESLQDVDEGMDMGLLKVAKVLINELPTVLRNHGMRSSVTSVSRDGQKLRIFGIY